MALYPHTFSGKETLQPGARGEIFQADLPGYRKGEDRINRTNMKLAASQHDVPNIKYEMDARLPVLFRYGYAYGYNQLVMPKGRIVAVDPNMNQLDFDTHKSYNVLTLANGGDIVKLGSDKKTWEKVVLTVEDNGTVKEGEAVLGVDPATGKITVNGVVRNDYRPANKPLGVIQRNEYTRDDDAYNGMQPGAVLTDAMIELPLFLDKAKAEQNPWGSIYGELLPGDLVKADANGRLIPSPLNSVKAMEAAGLDSAAKIEMERQQVVGQVYAIERDLLPAGAARYAQWALSDRMNFDQFNPEMWRANNRRGEDINERSPYKANGGGAINGSTPTKPGVDPFEPQGYPYDQTMTQHDLHMMASTVRKNDNRFGLEHQMENGIPGLTDGYNAVTREYRPEICGELRAASAANNYTDMFMKTSEVNIEKGTLKFALTTKDKYELEDGDFTSVTADGQTLKVTIGDVVSDEALIAVKYVDELQGFFVLTPVDAEKYHKFLTDNAAALEKAKLNVVVKFNKRGLSGVPTFMDWDGCQGYASILLQK